MRENTMMVFRTPQQQLEEIANDAHRNRITAIVNDVVSVNHDRYTFALSVVMSLLKRHPGCSDSFATEYLIHRLEDDDDEDE